MYPMLGTVFLVIIGCFIGLSSARKCVCGNTGRTTSPVNVRASASLSGRQLGTLSAGVCLDYLASEGAWYKITYNGQTAYIHSTVATSPHECKNSNQACAPRLCSSYSTNEKRGCDRQGCGHYGASRGGSSHRGWDIKCERGDTVYAPFDGTVTRTSAPYPGRKSCHNTGFVIRGSGAYNGHEVKIFYAAHSLGRLPANVKRGDAIAKHIGMYCDNSVPGITDHIHYQLEYRGTRIDPASYVFC